MSTCPSCGQPNENTDRFCFHCGSALTPPPKKGRWWPPVLALVLIFSIGLGVFFLFRTEPNVTTDPSMPWFTVRDGVLYFNNALYTGGSELTVPASIGDQQITAIGDSCFAFCTDVTMIHLPEGITYIGTDAFWGCENLRGIRLPESVTAIGDYVFDECYSLETVCIPVALTQFGSDLFADCYKLSYVFYTGTAEQWKQLGITEFAPGTVLSCLDGTYYLN